MLQALKGVRHLSVRAMKQTELSVPVPWGQLRGRIWGPDDGRPVLCLHGWSDNCGTFNTLIPLLPKECRYVALDLSGHGSSSHRPPGVFYTPPAYVMDVRRVIDALQWSRFSIIGHSMGGNIAGTFSSLYPEMVDAVVLLDSYGFFPINQEEMFKVMRKGMDEQLQFEKKTTEEKKRVYTYEGAVERLSAANPTLSEQSVRILLERGLVQVEGGVAFTRDVRINLKNILRNTLGQSLQLHSGIKAPMLVILAEDGFNKLFVGEDENMFSRIIQAYKDKEHKVVKIPGDHHIHLNNPVAVAPLVSDFLMTKVLTRPARRANEPTSKI
ncbi:serine hydrolase-like protein isoform X1 [Pungitius pungitius]|uniref:serine hydrolase-like protein isoform X1 n=2 Tax=Pungitius pungitius TaxID=134920 RepID=UPI002E1399F1